MSNTANILTKLKKKLPDKEYIVLVGVTLILVSGITYAFAYKDGSDKNVKPAPQSQAEHSERSNSESDVKSPAETSEPAAPAQPAVSKQCSKVPIPRKTVTKPDPRLYADQTVKGGDGLDGVKEICTDSNGHRTERVVYEPIDAVKYVGTIKRPKPEPATPKYTYEQAHSLAKQTCRQIIPAGSWDSTNMGDCVAREMRKYGY